MTVTALNISNNLIQLAQEKQKATRADNLDKVIVIYYVLHLRSPKKQTNKYTHTPAHTHAQ